MILTITKSLVWFLSSYAGSGSAIANEAKRGTRLLIWWAPLLQNPSPYLRGSL
jgi:hypothetical protein